MSADVVELTSWRKGRNAGGSVRKHMSLDAQRMMQPQISLPPSTVLAAVKDAQRVILALRQDAVVELLNRIVEARKRVNRWLPPFLRYTLDRAKILRQLDNERGPALHSAARGYRAARQLRGELWELSETLEKAALSSPPGQRLLIDRSAWWSLYDVSQDACGELQKELNF